LLRAADAVRHGEAVEMQLRTAPRRSAPRAISTGRAGPQESSVSREDDSFPTTRDLAEYDWDPRTGIATLVYERNGRHARVTREQRRWLRSDEARH